MQKQLILPVDFCSDIVGHLLVVWGHISYMGLRAMLDVVIMNEIDKVPVSHRQTNFGCFLSFPNYFVLGKDLGFFFKNKNGNKTCHLLGEMSSLNSGDVDHHSLTHIFIQTYTYLASAAEAYSVTLGHLFSLSLSQYQLLPVPLHFSSVLTIYVLNSSFFRIYSLNSISPTEFNST